MSSCEITEIDKLALEPGTFLGAARLLLTVHSPFPKHWSVNDIHALLLPHPDSTLVEVRVLRVYGRQELEVMLPRVMSHAAIDEIMTCLCEAS